jgi:hypothetical protein
LAWCPVAFVPAVLALGISNGAEILFMIAGGVGFIPVAFAVWTRIKPRVFLPIYRLPCLAQRWPMCFGWFCPKTNVLPKCCSNQAGGFPTS